MPVDLDEFIYARRGTISGYLKTLDCTISQVQVPWRSFGWATGFDDLIEMQEHWCFQVKAVRGAADTEAHDHVRDQDYWAEKDRNDVLDIQLLMKRHHERPDEA